MFMAKVLAITTASWAPLWIIKRMVEWADPDAVQKVRKAQ